MKAIKPALSKGTRDFGPEEVAKRQYILNIIKEAFELHGFQPLETPAIENLSTLTGKYGTEGDTLLFKLLRSGDYLRKAEDQLLQNRDYKALLPALSERGLRYDLTVPFARYVVMNRQDLPFPFKRYQIQPVWRADRPQNGRFQEFTQCDGDIIGSKSLLNEVELLQIINSVFKKLGLQQISIKINNRKILEGIAEVIGASNSFTDITIAIDKLDKIGMEKVKLELTERGLEEKMVEALDEFLSFEGTQNEVIDFLKEKLKDSETGSKGVEEMEELLSYLDEEMPLEFDLTLARGLSYYTGTIIEVVPIGTQMRSSIVGGGRYDDLTSIFGLKDVSGVGFSFGLDRIYIVLEELGLFQKVDLNFTKVLFINFDEDCQKYVFKQVQSLRKEGVASEIFPEPAKNGKKLKKQMTYANRKKIPYVILTGPEEMASGLFSLKNMESGEQESLTIEAITQKLL